MTIGPVQEFIAQARRTRDLWFGSHLLSELSRAAARRLTEAGAELIFPALGNGDVELDPCPASLRPDKSPPLNIANKLIASVPSGIDSEQLARTTREAVGSLWASTASAVFFGCRSLLAPRTESIWIEQIETLVEFAAAWAPLDGEYAYARQKIEQAIAGRKNLRDFAPWNALRGGVHKSSLDGGRETVLLPNAERPRRLAATYGIANSEQLDAIGLIKRASGKPEQFVPIVNVAAASWLAKAKCEAPRQLEALIIASQDAELSQVHRRDLPCARDFPVDASILFRNRWKSVFAERDRSKGNDNLTVFDFNAWGEKNVLPLLNALAAPPYPYVACLVADGDHMGRAIGKLGSANQHRKFSSALAAFSDQARNVVEQQHCGSLVYAGGDDVLAFVPLPEALECAGSLRRSFEFAMRAACESFPIAERPTLSVGLGIGHVMESMGDLLALGREAEGHAKSGGDAGNDRNALAIVVDKRSGGVRRWRARWDEWEGKPIERIREDVALLRERLSVRKVYEIARMLARMPRPTDVSADVSNVSWANALEREVNRSLDRASSGDSRLALQEIGLWLTSSGEYGALHASLQAWIERILIARSFANAEPTLKHLPKESAA